MARISTRRILLLVGVLPAVVLFLHYLNLRNNPRSTLIPDPFPKAFKENLPPAFAENPKVKDDCSCDDLKILRMKETYMIIETNEEVVVNFLQRNNITARKGLGRRREGLDPEFEKPLFMYPPLRHSVCLPDYSRSKVRLLTPADQILMGSTIRFRIDLYTSCGQPRFLGGDIVRAWLKQTSGDKTSSVAAKVKDLHNGSYVGESLLPWPGVTLVRVSLTYAREFLRMSVEMYHSLHSMRWSAEKMDDGKGLTEEVACLPVSPIPGYDKTCDFTEANGNIPWFCGHPVTKGLNCNHRSAFRDLFFLTPLPIPPLLRNYVNDLNSCCSNPQKMDMRLIVNDIKLDTYHGKLTPEAAGKLAPPPFIPPALPPCHSRPPIESWVQPTPRGWLRDGQWVPAACSLPPLTEDRVLRCMTNRTLLLLGDSNQRLLWNYIRDMADCSFRNVPDEWNSPHICRNPPLRSTVIYTAHAFPFLTGSHGTLPILNLPLPLALKKIEDLAFKGANDVTVVIHYNTHLSTYPVQVYRTFVQAARRTVQEYLKVHPKVKFVIRGPHVQYHAHNLHVHFGDKFGMWYQQIWKKEFGELSEKVWFLDTWDMTLAAENWSMHPDSVNSEIAKLLFGYICDEG